MISKDDKFDRHYGWPWYFESNSTAFLGFKSTIIRWNSFTRQWKISLYNNPYVYATLNGSFESIFGENLWYFTNSTCGVTSYLSFSRCMRDEFICLDGTWYVFVYMILIQF